VANAFGVSTDYLLTGKRSNSEPNEFAAKISVLDEQEMDLLEQIIELFIMACKKEIKLTVYKWSKATDWAEEIKYLADVIYPDAEKLYW